MSYSRRWSHHYLAIIFALSFLLLVNPSESCADEPTAPADSSATQEDEAHKMEVIVVTGSGKYESVKEASAAVSVVPGEQVLKTPVTTYGDVIRSIPGVNVSQTSAATTSISTRNATAILPQTQLVLVDYRPVYQDFNGFVLWNTIPLQKDDIKQIEVVRGPGSAVWGANAVDGVIHIISKSPRESLGTRLMFGGGELGSIFSSLRHAGARGRLSYKISAGFRKQDAFERPTGVVPGSIGPNAPEGSQYIDFENKGTTQPKLDVRVDYESGDDQFWSLSGGYAATDGTFLTPTGHFDYRPDDSGIKLTDNYEAYGKVDWRRRNARITASGTVNQSRGEFVYGNFPADNSTETYQIDYADNRGIGDRHLLTYGGSVRYAAYNVSLAPEGDNRDSYGAFVQDDFSLNNVVRLVAGIRWDNVFPMGDAFSPRLSLIYEPNANHQFRASYNRAFHPPTMLEGFSDFFVGVQILGNEDLEAEILDSFELGWKGSVTNSLSLTADAYISTLNNYVQTVVPEPGISSFMNSGDITNQGLELGLQYFPGLEWTVSANYSWQKTPETNGVDKVLVPSGNLILPVNLPPEHRVNVGLYYDTPRFFANASAHYQDTAYWTDMTDPHFWGPTESFTQVNLGAGVRLNGGRLVLSATAANLFDERIQQHIWGDILNRVILAQAAYHF